MNTTTDRDRAAAAAYHHPLVSHSFLVSKPAYLNLSTKERRLVVVDAPIPVPPPGAAASTSSTRSSSSPKSSSPKSFLSSLLSHAISPAPLPPSPPPATVASSQTTPSPHTTPPPPPTQPPSTTPNTNTTTAQNKPNQAFVRAIYVTTTDPRNPQTRKILPIHLITALLVDPHSPTQLTIRSVDKPRTFTFETKTQREQFCKHVIDIHQRCARDRRARQQGKSLLPETGNSSTATLQHSHAETTAAIGTTVTSTATTVAATRTALPAVANDTTATTLSARAVHSDGLVSAPIMTKTYAQAIGHHYTSNMDTSYGHIMQSNKTSKAANAAPETHCALCRVAFGMLVNWRKRCRGCYIACCANCSPNRAILPWLGTVAMRVCIICYDRINEANNGVKKRRPGADHHPRAAQHDVWRVSSNGGAAAGGGGGGGKNGEHTLRMRSAHQLFAGYSTIDDHGRQRGGGAFFGRGTAASSSWSSLSSNLSQTLPMAENAAAAAHIAGFGADDDGSELPFFMNGSDGKAYVHDEFGFLCKPIATHRQHHGGGGGGAAGGNYHANANIDMDTIAAHSLAAHSARTLALRDAEYARQRWMQYLQAGGPLERRHAPLVALVREVGVPPELRGQVCVNTSGANAYRDRLGGTAYFEACLRGSVAPTSSKRSSSSGGANLAADGISDSWHGPRGTRSRTDDDRMARLAIEKDLHRTFPDNVAFQHGSGVSALRNVLLAYATHNPHIGYCQSMNLLCAVFLLFHHEEDAFWMLIAMCEGLCCVAADRDEAIHGQPSSSHRVSSTEGHPLSASSVFMQHGESSSPWMSTTNALLKTLKGMVSSSHQMKTVSPGSSIDTWKTSAGAPSVSASRNDSMCDIDVPFGVAEAICILPPESKRGHLLFYHQHDLGGVCVDQEVASRLIARIQPRIYTRLVQLQVPLQPLFANWLLSLFVNVLPLRICLQLHDCAFLEGVCVFFRAILAIMQLHEGTILMPGARLDDVMQCFQCLTNSTPPLSRRVFFSVCNGPKLTKFVNQGTVRALREQVLESESWDVPSTPSRASSGRSRTLSLQDALVCGSQGATSDSSAAAGCVRASDTVAPHNSLHYRLVEDYC